MLRPRQFLGLLASFQHAQFIIGVIEQRLAIGADAEIADFVGNVLLLALLEVVATPDRRWISASWRPNSPVRIPSIGSVVKSAPLGVPKTLP